MQKETTERQFHLHLWGLNRFGHIWEVMEKPEKPKSNMEQAAEDLFNYSIDRYEVKWLMANLAEEADIKRTTVEYELPILKIISL